MPVRRRRERRGDSTEDTPEAAAPDVVWALDFQFDADEQGRAIKIASIIDECTREYLGGRVERSTTGDALTTHLEALTAQRSAPEVLRCDNGPELPSQAMAEWPGERVGIHYIPPRS